MCFRGSQHWCLIILSDVGDPSSLVSGCWLPLTACYCKCAYCHAWECLQTGVALAIGFIGHSNTQLVTILYRTLLHTVVFLSHSVHQSLLTAPNSRHSPSSGFPNCPRALVTATLHSTTSPRLCTCLQGLGTEKYRSSLLYPLLPYKHACLQSCYSVIFVP
jgi:hypothetical protein